MEQEKEIQQFKNRLRELADKAFSQNIFTFTSFLGLGEQDIFRQMEQELAYAGCTLFGGGENTDRKLARFGSEEAFGYTEEFPIVCIHIRPAMAKFADSLSHRDFLGALMNLGIRRSALGDIKVGDKEAYLFCLKSVAALVCEQLTQVKHTHVRCRIVEEAAEMPVEEPEHRMVQVASLRADAVIAKVYDKSREGSLELFRAQKVYVEGRLCENNARQLKPGETVNARGHGKFRILGEPRETRKGKLSVEVAVYR